MGFAKYDDSAPTNSGGTGSDVSSTNPWDKNEKYTNTLQAAEAISDNTIDSSAFTGLQLKSGTANKIAFYINGNEVAEITP